MSEVSWKDRYERLTKRQHNEEAKTDEMVNMGIDQLLAHASGAAVAYAHGRKGGMPAIARLPVDALIAGAGNLLGWGLMATGHMIGRHVVAFASGPSIWFVGGLAAKAGNKAREKKGEMLNREPTAKEQEDGNFQYRPPIIAGGQQGGAYTRPAAHQFAGRY